MNTYPDPRPVVSQQVPDSIRNGLRDFYQELPRRPGDPVFSLTRTLQQMHTPQGLRDGYERELLGGFALALGRHFDPHRVVIPFGALGITRDLTVASAAAGGYLVGEEQGRIVDALRGWSIVTDGGAVVVPMGAGGGNLSIPKNLGGADTTWLGTEATSATEVSPLVAELGLSPKTVAVYAEFSHLLTKLAPQLELFLRLRLIGSVGQAIDTAVFGGSGASGQPLGILNTAGVGIVSGTSLGWTGVRTMRRTAIAAGAREANMLFVGGATTQDLLAGRERISGGGRAIWDDANVAGLRGVATNRIPLDAAVAGDFSQLVVAMWGGIEVEINPFANFQAGIQGARVMVSMDAGCTQPSAFSVATSIT